MINKIGMTNIKPAFQAGSTIKVDKTGQITHREELNEKDTISVIDEMTAVLPLMEQVKRKDNKVSYFMDQDDKTSFLKITKEGAYLNTLTNDEVFIHKKVQVTDPKEKPAFEKLLTAAGIKES